MNTRLRSVRIVLALPPRDFAVFTDATRLLRRVMGRKAPNVLALVTRALSHREPLGIADDYLDAIKWPMSQRRALRARAGCRRGLVEYAQLTELLRPSSDPSRN